MTEKEKFLQKFNDAFAKGDTDYIAENVTEDVQWAIVGDQAVQGKEAFIKLVEQMLDEGNLELKLNQIVTHGKTAAVEGTMIFTNKSRKKKNYAFCDVYTFSGFKNPKIKAMTSYVIEING